MDHLLKCDHKNQVLHRVSTFQTDYITRAVLVFVTERKNNADPPLAIPEEGELHSTVFCTYNFRV